MARNHFDFDYDSQRGESPALRGRAKLRFACPVCKATMTAPPEKAGHKFNCLKCGQRIQIPSPPRGTILARPLPEQPGPTPATPGPSAFRDLGAVIPGPSADRPRPRRHNGLLIGWLVTGAALILVTLAGGIVVMVFLVRQAPNVTVPPVPAAKTRPVEEIDLDDFFRAWSKNPISVEQRFRGKLMRTTGYLVAIQQNVHNQQYVLIGTQAERRFDSPELLAYVIDKDVMKQLGKIDCGSRVTVEVALDQGADNASPRSTLRAARLPTD
jgi:hypothetical protein